MRSATDSKITSIFVSDFPFPCSASPLKFSSVPLMTLSSLCRNYFSQWPFLAKPLFSLTTMLSPFPVAV